MMECIVLFGKCVFGGFLVAIAVLSLGLAVVWAERWYESIRRQLDKGDWE